MAYILRFKTWLLNKMRCKLGQTKSQCSPIKGRVTVDEMLIAEREVLKVVQKRAFPKEVKQLTEASPSDDAMTKSVKKSSSIRNLDPFMGDGLLRVGGRLRHASIEAGARNPIILPKKAPVRIKLLVRIWLKIKLSFRSFYVLIYCLKARVSIVRKTMVRNHRRAASSPSAKFKYLRKR